MAESLRELVFTTWLAPGLPVAQFETIARHVSNGLGCRYRLEVEPDFSGPVRSSDDRFAQGSTDVGFVCPTSYLWLSQRSPSSVALVPVAPVYQDARGHGHPVYFSDVIVRADSAITEFDDLAGRCVGFNDRSSLSGYYSVLTRLDQDGRDESYFAEFRPIGGHRQALNAILGREIDGAAIDANVWEHWRNENPHVADKLCSVAVLGPFPVQPIVVRAALAEMLLEPLTDLLLRSELLEALQPFGITAFGPIDRGGYSDLCARLARVARSLYDPPA